MNTFVQAVINWLRQPDFEDRDKNLTALYIQAITLVIITVAVILGVVYAVAGQTIYVVFLVADIVTQVLVIGLIRFKKLQSALTLFLIAALALLNLGILSGGGIHASSALLYPVILLFASLLLDRKSYITYVGLCIASISIIIFAENQKLTPVYVPDAPELPLFLSVGLIVLSAAFISRFITENLQNNIRKSRLYAQDLSNQKAMLDRVGQAVVGCLVDNTIIYWNLAATDLYGWKAEETIGRAYYDIVPTQLTPEMIEAIRVTLRSGEVWSGEFTVQRRDQTLLTVLGTVSALRDETGSVVGWIGVAADLSERVKVAEVDKRRADEMSLLYRLGVSLASGENLYDTLLALQTEIIKLIQADAFYVAIYDEATDIVKYPIFFDEGKPLQETDRLLHEWPGLTGAVIFSGKTLYLPDMFEPEVEEIYRPHDTNDLVLHTFLGIPLSVDGHILGMLSVQSNVVDAYTPDQIQLMETVALQAAIAIDKAHLLDQLKQELIERKRAEDQLLEREAILEAITFSAEQFLKTADWRTNIDLVLERLGKTLNITHAYLFEDHLDAEGEAVTSMRYEWTAPGYPSDLDGQYFQDSKIEQKGFEDHVEALRRGDVRIGNVSTFNPIEKESMAELGVKAILEVPIFVNDKEWGAIGFDDFEREREWSHAEVDALKIAAGVLSAAIQRQEAESAIHESERIYRQAIEAADAVPYYQDYESSSYLFMGESIFEMTGYTSGEMKPQTWLELVQETVLLGEAAGLSVNEAVEFVRQGKLKTWKCDQRIIRRDGQVRWLTDRSIELLDENNISYGSIGILQDITERKLVEANLRKRESLLEAVTFAAEHFLKTPDWRARIDIVLERLGTEFNASHAYLFEKNEGHQSELLSSMTHEWTAPGCISDLDDPEYQDFPINPSGSLKRVYDILDRGEPLVGSSSFFSAEERAYYVDTIHIKALLEMRIVVDGRQWGTIGFDDISNEREWTAMEVDVIKVVANLLGVAIKRQMDEAALQRELDERKRAEQALRFSEEKFSKAFHTTQIFMTIEDDQNLIVDANKSFVDTFGIDRAAVIGRKVSDLKVLYESVDAEALSREYQARGFLRDFETRFRRKSGEMGFVLLSSESFYVDHVRYTLTSGLDITERKQAEAEREKLIADLESKNDELERFTYTVSHDLKSPLVTINGFLGYLEQDAASGNMERLKRDVQRIHEAVNKMQRLLNELLELSRIGRMANPPETAKFEELAYEAIAIVQGRLDEKNVTVHIQSNLPAVFVDKPRVVEVLQNLLDNAAKYMGNQIEPRIDIGQRGEERGQSVFYVKDNGMGVAPEYHERIFGLFNKLDPKTEGTGVGLALVKRIIEVHGGRIWIESEGLGKGASFCFTLPRSTVVA